MLSLNPCQARVLEFPEVVRERRAGDSKLGLYVRHDHSIGVSRQEKPHNTESRLCSDGRQHLGESHYIGFFGSHQVSLPQKRRKFL